MTEPYDYKGIVTTFPPEKSPKGVAVLRKFETQSGETLRLRLSADIARHLGTRLLPLSANSGALDSRQ